MISLSPNHDLVTFADQCGWSVCEELDRSGRASQGQFFSPAETARYLASCYTNASFGNKIVLHDPGAGSGVLSAAFVESLLKRVQKGQVKKPSHVTLVACEQDGDFLQALHDVLNRCKMALEQQGISAKVIIRESDWIESSVESLDSGLLPSEKIPLATHAILNPPYKKLSSSSKQRRLLSRVGIETSNLYSAFVWLCVLQTKPKGELCAITPRSFCNGPYFRPFRNAILESTQIRLLHQIDSRNEVFQRDKVLQENIIYLLSKKPTRQSKVTLACGSFAQIKLRKMNLDEVVHPQDSESFIHLATESDHQSARDFVMNQSSSLVELGLNVSTGPVVDFRLRKDLSHSQSADTYPLIYPHLFNNGKVLRPPQKSEDADNLRQRKKPVAIRDTARTEKFLVKRGCYVLIKRFTSKEEKRRIVACVLDPKDFPEKKIGLENHINYFHANGKGLTKKLAKGLAAYLNSPEVDQYFRQFNGHTQVNATDLRNLRYPTEDELISGNPRTR